jgi:hypothetical protein
MSQSDYIRYKKTGTLLKQQSKLPAVLEPDDLTEFKEYSLENTIFNTKIRYNQLIPANKVIVYGMERLPTSCPTFAVCSNTNARTNRVLSGGRLYATTPARPVYRPPRPLNEKQTQVLISETDLCVCTNN